MDSGDPAWDEVRRRTVARQRERLQRAALSIQDVNAAHWRVSGRERTADYYPIEDRWRCDGIWGRGTLTLIAKLKEGA
jgi:hypothetical protein